MQLKPLRQQFKALRSRAGAPGAPPAPPEAAAHLAAGAAAGVPRAGAAAAPAEAAQSASQAPAAAEPAPSAAPSGAAGSAAGLQASGVADMDVDGDPVGAADGAAAPNGAGAAGAPGGGAALGAGSAAISAETPCGPAVQLPATEPEAPAAADRPRCSNGAAAVGDEARSTPNPHCGRRDAPVPLSLQARSAARRRLASIGSLCTSATADTQPWRHALLPPKIFACFLVCSSCRGPASPRHGPQRTAGAGTSTSWGRAASALRVGCLPCALPGCPRPACSWAAACVAAAGLRQRRRAARLLGGGGGGAGGRRRRGRAAGRPGRLAAGRARPARPRCAPRAGAARANTRPYF